MNQKSKVMVRIEYEEGELQKVCYGEIEEKKIENFNSGDDDFICIENNGLITWLDKESIIYIETLEVSKILILKPKITDYTGFEGKSDKGARIST